MRGALRDCVIFGRRPGRAPSRRRRYNADFVILTAPRSGDEEYKAKSTNLN
jgi:hypothetical protein